jgi:hypothetical protein
MTGIMGCDCMPVCHCCIMPVPYGPYMKEGEGAECMNKDGRLCEPEEAVDEEPKVLPPGIFLYGLTERFPGSAVYFLLGGLTDCFPSSVTGFFLEGLADRFLGSVTLGWVL